MTFAPSDFIAAYERMDALLVAGGFPATSPWWLSQIRRFVSARRRRWVIRAGRRAGKSTTLCRLAIAWALWGAWDVPPGDIAVVPFVSTTRDEASARLRTIADVLRALGVPFERRGDEIELGGLRRVLFRIHACSIRSVVGFTSIAIFGDEVARWEDRETAANPAAAVIGSLSPSLATQPHGFLVLSSSPWTVDDFHAEAFDRGDDEHQAVSFAETWTANPTLTEAATRALEPDERTWLREYAAQPSDAVSNNWFGTAAIDRSIDDAPPQPIIRDARYWVGVDPAFANDRFGWAVVSSQIGEYDLETRQRGPRITRVHATGAWKPDMSPRNMAARLMREVCLRYGVRHVYSDQHEGRSWSELASDVGLRVNLIPWTAGTTEGSKSDRYRLVRTTMLEGSFRLPNDPDLLREFRSVRGTLTPSGNERIEVPRSALGHGDRVSAVVLAASEALYVAPNLPPSREHWVEQLEHERACREAEKAVGCALPTHFRGQRLAFRRFRN